jgi:hypothetical protein
LFDIALIDRYILVIADEPSFAAARFTVSSIHSLAEYWSPIDLMEQWKSVMLDDIPKLITEKFEHRLRRDRLSMSAHASPFREGFYNLWISITEENISAIRKYTLSCPPAASKEPLHLSLRSFTRANRRYPIYGDISYSGHTEIFDIDLDRAQRVLALPELPEITEAADVKPGTVDLPDVGDIVHTSAYSGALTYCTPHSVVVNYYQ